MPDSNQLAYQVTPGLSVDDSPAINPLAVAAGGDVRDYRNGFGEQAQRQPKPNRYASAPAAVEKPISLVPLQPNWRQPVTPKAPMTLGQKIDWVLTHYNVFPIFAKTMQRKFQAASFPANGHPGGNSQLSSQSVRSIHRAQQTLKHNWRLEKATLKPKADEIVKGLDDIFPEPIESFFQGDTALMGPELAEVSTVVELPSETEMKAVSEVASDVLLVEDIQAEPVVVIPDFVEPAALLEKLPVKPQFSFEIIEKEPVQTIEPVKMIEIIALEAVEPEPEPAVDALEVATPALQPGNDSQPEPEIELESTQDPVLETPAEVAQVVPAPVHDRSIISDLVEAFRAPKEEHIANGLLKSALSFLSPSPKEETLPHVEVAPQVNEELLFPSVSDFTHDFALQTLPPVEVVEDVLEIATAALQPCNDSQPELRIEAESELEPELEIPAVLEVVIEDDVAACDVLVEEVSELETLVELDSSDSELIQGTEDFSFQSMLHNNRILSKSISNLASSYFDRAAQETLDAQVSDNLLIY